MTDQTASEPSLQAAPVHFAETLLPGLEFAATRQHFVTQAMEFDLPILIDNNTELRVQTDYGQYGFHATTGGTRAEIRSGRADWLYVLKDALHHTVEHMLPEVADSMHWSDARQQAGSLPANFQFITIRSCEEIPGNFLRITARAEDLSVFGSDAIHFRLALPPAGQAQPQWPHQSDKGVTVWPKGDAALHRPVYTLRNCDPATDTVVFDVFIHEGGRTTQWARAVQPGDRVGLTGPGGGGVPSGARLHVYADETGYPAVARLLAEAPLDTGGIVVLQATAEHSESYPLPAHPGFELRFLPPYSPAAPQEDLAELAIRTHRGEPDAILWFAAEKNQAQTLRGYTKSAGLSARDGHYIAGFWNRD